MAYLSGEARMPAPVHEFSLYAYGLHTHMQYSQLWDTLPFASYLLPPPSPGLKGGALNQQNTSRRRTNQRNRKPQL